MHSKKLGIRLALHGCTNRPFYHIVVMKKYKARDDKPLEQLGSFDPLPNKYGEKLCAINFDRLNYWLGRNAEPSKPILKLLGYAGYFPIYPMTYLNAKRLKKAAEAEKIKKEAEQLQEQESAATLEKELESS